jgi:hypothetical protein
VVSLCGQISFGVVSARYMRVSNRFRRFRVRLNVGFRRFPPTYDEVVLRIWPEITRAALLYPRVQFNYKLGMLIPTLVQV